MPTVSSVTSTKADRGYTVGATIPITITFNQTVTVAGTPQLTLETGTTDVVVEYTSGTGTATLTFNYIIGTGTSISVKEFINLSMNCLNLNDFKWKGSVKKINCF